MSRDNEPSEVESPPAGATDGSGSAEKRETDPGRSVRSTDRSIAAEERESTQSRLFDQGSTLDSIVDVFRGDRMGQVGIAILVVFLLVGALAPILAPYDPDERIRGDDGRLESLQPPSLEHPFGTTVLGRDVFSQVIVSARVSLIVGLLASFMAVAIGTNIGLISGFMGGWVDDLLMRLTDLAYGLPFLPFIIVLVVILGPDLYNLIIAIALLEWRQSARVIRSQVLSHKERPYVESARTIGASDLRIMYVHILPNVLPLVFLYAAFAIAFAIIFEASISFLGYGDPLLYSWGKMIFTAYSNDVIRQAWWWVVPPGAAIMLVVMSVFFLGRTLEKLTNPELDDGGR
jgi:peptide/nickel transport system permease protein